MSTTPPTPLAKAPILKSSKSSPLTPNHSLNTEERSCVSPTELQRRDFYGNPINQKKKQTVFFNMSANRVYLVESWKRFNKGGRKVKEKLDESDESEDDICTVF